MRAAMRPLMTLALAAALAACGGAGETGEPASTTEDGDETASAPVEAPAADACPLDSEIAGIVGAPVASKPGGAMCFYETADFDASVTIMRITPGQADQIEGEMRDAAAPYGATVEPIDVGDRGSAWGSPGYGQGYAIEGDQGWLADVSDNSGGSGDRRAQVIRILERMIG